ncbi:MAG: hypothetical protein O7F12_14325, partial [Nitrospirae bacterium]|nr:hypothetical protein [Nitrospirota bacterium]
LVKQLCDLTWPETARELGVISYGAVGLACGGAGETGCGATIQEASGGGRGIIESTKDLVPISKD